MNLEVSIPVRLDHPDSDASFEVSGVTASAKLQVGSGVPHVCFMRDQMTDYFHLLKYFEAKEF